MIPTWPMVFAALIAGVIAGFMIPDRPQSRSAAVAVEASTPEKQDETKAARAGKASDSKSTQLAGSENLKETQADGGPCALDAWPYRKPGCLDRTATVAPVNTTVSVRPADPDTVVWQEGEKKPAPEPVKSAETPAPATAPVKAVEAPKQDAVVPETRKQSPAVAETPKENAAETAAARPATQPAPAAPQTAPGVQRAAFGAEPAARQADENRPRRPARRATGVPDFNDGIPTRVYLRGPDGRLYLAPDYRPPSGRTVYYVR